MMMICKCYILYENKLNHINIEIAIQNHTHNVFQFEASIIENMLIAVIHFTVS